jgi:hypothetical protein
MAAVRRSARIASMNPPHADHSVRVVTQEMNAITADAFKTVRLLRDIIKERGEPDEITADALVWITQVSWAIEDCHEFKTRQLTENCDDSVLRSIPPFVGLLRHLTSEINALIEHFRPYPLIPRSLILSATTFIASIKSSFYQI